MTHLTIYAIMEYDSDLGTWLASDHYLEKSRAQEALRHADNYGNPATKRWDGQGPYIEEIEVH